MRNENFAGLSLPKGHSEKGNFEAGSGPFAAFANERAQGRAFLTSREERGKWALGKKPGGDLPALRTFAMITGFLHPHARQRIDSRRLHLRRQRLQNLEEHQRI